MFTSQKKSKLRFRLGKIYILEHKLQFGEQMSLRKVPWEFAKRFFAIKCRSVEEDLTSMINVVGNLVTRADGFCGALKRAPYGST